jgi:serine/threonine protein kinase
MSSDPLSDRQLQIAQRCSDHERLTQWDADFRRCVRFEDFFVKYDSFKSMYPEFRTQQYLAQVAVGDPDAPRVAQVCDFFTLDKMAYLVMEYIEPNSVPVPDLPQRAARALQWLRGVRLPDDVPFGESLGGGRLRHPLFKDFEAPLRFSSIEALERYLNKVRPCV